MEIRINSAWLELSLIVSKFHSVQVEILPKHLLYFYHVWPSLARSALWLDDLEIRLDSAQLELELDNIVQFLNILDKMICRCVVSG